MVSRLMIDCADICSAYYTVRQVISEARPFDGLPEVLSDATEQVTVTTPGEILGGGGSSGGGSSGQRKHFILMTLNDRYMSIDGVRQEIDPGYNTTPILLNSTEQVVIVYY